MRIVAVLVLSIALLTPSGAWSQEVASGVTADFEDPEEVIVVTGWRINRDIPREEWPRRGDALTARVDDSGPITTFTYSRRLFTLAGVPISAETRAVEQTIVRYGPPEPTNRVPHLGGRIELNPIQPWERRQ